MLIEIPQNPIIIQTRAGNPIPNEAPPLKMSEEVVRQANQWQQGEYPAGLRLKKRKEPTVSYNCHGLTFLSRRAFLLDEKGIELVLLDDQYFSVQLDDVLPGDIILYHDAQTYAVLHSGIVVYVPYDEVVNAPWVLSKWGQTGEYLHRFNYCPYDCSRIRYLREGKND